MFRVTFSDPEVIVNGVDGETMAPAGRPFTLIATEAANPFTAVTMTRVNNAPPGVTVAELGNTEIAKSGCGPDPPPPVEPVLPQLETTTARAPSTNIWVKRFKRALPSRTKRAEVVYTRSYAGRRGIVQSSLDEDPPFATVRPEMSEVTYPNLALFPRIRRSPSTFLTTPSCGTFGG